MACPDEVIWADVGDPVLPGDLEPAPQDVQFRGSSDKVPAVDGFLHTPVEAEEQEDVASTNALLVQVPLSDAGLAKQPRHCCQAARFFRYRYVSKLMSGSRWTRSCPFMRPLVTPATTLAMSPSPC